MYILFLENSDFTADKASEYISVGVIYFMCRITFTWFQKEYNLVSRCL
jgi:hypothetical protein